MPRPIYTIALALLVIALVLAGIHYRREAVLRSRAHEAARRGAAWLLAQEQPIRDPGILWIISAIDAKYCQDPEIHAFLARRFQEFEQREHPIFASLRALSLGEREQGLAVFAERWEKWRNKGDVVAAMAYGVYCDRMPLPEPVARTLLARDIDGYTLTHQLLALQYMKQNGCLTPEQEQVRRDGARKLAAEQAADPVFSDLSAERVATLFFVDFPELVERAWIETLIAKQEPSGAWADPNFPKRFYKAPQNPHTSVLGVWALSEFSRSCPFRD